jgi:plasmid maintenance system antidote protein VapI
MEKNLNKRITKTATSWKTRAKQDRVNRRNISRAQEFALELLDYMELNNIKQKDLALKMGVTAPQVNKILRAKANLTFETLDKISVALGVVISSPKILKNTNIKSETHQNSMMVVYSKNRKKIKENLTTENVVTKNAFMKENLEETVFYGFTSGKI